ncbi:hypothetical protein PRZ48_011798 [Zasmidium cellare]|uniref:DJ-1/PfpI domain-containing protein n=1 Tax=Zasmidium cellare TaxID=395010 RepID=A0ABR0E7E5_ZASCE|nr:hypothetical protein PRZ48_011798 [Zasmidium cellare]
MSSQPFRILAPIFPNFNILDLTGPAEVFGNSRIDPSLRSLDIVASTEKTQSYEGITVARDVTYSELDLEKYDMLLLPGASPQFVLEAIEEDAGLMDVVRRFAGLKGGEGKWLFSVCTGALFLGAAGVLSGRTATTHWRALDLLREVCGKVGGKETEVVRKRFVDGGKTEGGMRVVNAGGVSCGIDASLWIVKETKGVEMAEGIAGVMDYKWAFEGVEVEVTERFLV